MNMYIAVTIKHIILQSDLQTICLRTSSILVSSKGLITNWKLQGKHYNKSSFTGQCCINSAVIDINFILLDGKQEKSSSKSETNTIFYLITVVDTNTPLFSRHRDLWFTSNKENYHRQQLWRSFLRNYIHCGVQFIILND